MITTKDIVKGVNRLLISKYKGLVYSTDDKKKIKNGSFRVETPFPIVNVSSGFQTEEGTIRIYYFPLDEDETRLEFINKMAELRELFSNGVEINDSFVLPVFEMEFSNIDEVLMMEFDYMICQTFETADEKNAEIMENLEIKEAY